MGEDMGEDRIVEGGGREGVEGGFMCFDIVLEGVVCYRVYARV